MCGELMRLSDREIQERVPGSARPVVRRAREWICPECDYFEEAEGGEG
jgi:acetone carboxylase gamma subunit